MALTLGNYATTLSPDLIAQAKKTKVRECDETEKGHFVAYVDEGKESYDVSLTIKANKEITNHNCECNNLIDFCRHKTALVIHITDGKKPKAVVKVKKKENKAEAMLADIEPEKLKEWLIGIMAKNKDIELSFLHYFSAKKQPTPAEVVKIVNEAVNVVIGKKKSVDPTQLKKLVELWSEMLAPVAEDYRENVSNEISFLNFHEMLETCFAFWRNFDFGSNKVLKFIEDMLLKSVEPVGNLLVEETWDKSVGFFINRVPDGKNMVRTQYLAHLKNIAAISDPTRKVRIIDRLALQYEKSRPDTLMNGKEYTRFIFDFIAENNIINKFILLFKPIRFDNEYNAKLIRLLIDNNELATAKKYCDEQISYNFREEYNILYLNFLKEIYLLKKEEKALIDVLTKLIPFTFNFDDYVFISESLPEDERKKFRTKILTKSRNASAPYRKRAIEFHFKMADTEKNYRKMIEYINSETPYPIILQYFEHMAKTNKEELLKVMLNKNDDFIWNKPKNNDEESFPLLLNLFITYYGKVYLKIAIANYEKGGWYSRLNGLFIYIKEQL